MTAMNLDEYNRLLEQLSIDERDQLTQVRASFAARRESLRAQFQDIEAQETRCWQQLLITAVEAFDDQLNKSLDQGMETFCPAGRLCKPHGGGITLASMSYPGEFHSWFLPVEHLPLRGATLIHLGASLGWSDHPANQGKLLEVRIEADMYKSRPGDPADGYGRFDMPDRRERPRRYVPALKKLVIPHHDSDDPTLHATTEQIKRRAHKALAEWLADLREGLVPSTLNEYDLSDKGGWGEAVQVERI